MICEALFPAVLTRPQWTGLSETVSQANLPLSCFLFLSGIVSEMRNVTQLGLPVEVKPAQHLARQFYGWIKYLVYCSCPHLWGFQAFSKSLFSVSFASSSIEISSERTWCRQLHPCCVRVKRRSPIPNSPVSLRCPRRHGFSVLTCSTSWDSWGWPLLPGAIGLSNSPIGNSTAVRVLLKKPRERVLDAYGPLPLCSDVPSRLTLEIQGYDFKKANPTCYPGRESQLLISLCGEVDSFLFFLEETSC